MSRLTQSIHLCFGLTLFLLPGGSISPFFRWILGLASLREQTTSVLLSCTLLWYSLPPVSPWYYRLPCRLSFRSLSDGNKSDNIDTFAFITETRQMYGKKYFIVQNKTRKQCIWETKILCMMFLHKTNRGTKLYFNTTATIFLSNEELVLSKIVHNIIVAYTHICNIYHSCPPHVCASVRRHLSSNNCTQTCLNESANSSTLK